MHYAYSKEKYGRIVSSYIFTRGNEDIAGVHYSIRKSGLELFVSADIQTGFVFAYQPDPLLIDFLLDHFLEYSRSSKADYLRISLWLPKSIKGRTTGYPVLFHEKLSSRKFVVAENGPHTYWIDLSKSEDVLLGNMKRQTRYDVKKGLKSEIRTIQYETSDKETIEQFWSLYKQVAETKKFNRYTEDKFKNEIITLLDSGVAVIFVEEYKGKIINFSLASNFGVASYMHGAIDMKYKEYEDCPPPGHLAQWEMITGMKARGASLYDMGFCPGPVPQKEHPSYNIWRFKYGFGGDHVEFFPVYERSFNPVKLRLYKLFK